MNTNNLKFNNDTIKIVCLLFTGVLLLYTHWYLRFVHFSGLLIVIGMILFFIANYLIIAKIHASLSDRIRVVNYHLERFSIIQYLFAKMVALLGLAMVMLDTSALLFFALNNRTVLVFFTLASLFLIAFARGDYKEAIEIINH